VLLVRNRHASIDNYLKASCTIFIRIIIKEHKVQIHLKFKNKLRKMPASAREKIKNKG